MWRSGPIRRIRIRRRTARAIGSAIASRFPACLRTIVTGLHDGGVYLNVGSAVVMPEVFLKAVSVVRNLGYPLAQFTTVNFDFLQHYRPEGERGGAAACAIRRQGLLHHRVITRFLFRCWPRF